MDGRTEGPRKEVGSVQGEGDDADGRGAVDAAAEWLSASACSYAPACAQAARRWVGTFTWPDLKWSDRRLRAHRRGHKGELEGGEGAQENILFSFVPRSFFSDSVLPSLPPSFPPLIFRRQVCSVVLGAVGVVPTRQASPAYSCHRPKEGRTEAAGKICESLNAELPFSQPRIACLLDVLQYKRSGRHWGAVDGRDVGSVAV